MEGIRDTVVAGGCIMDRRSGGREGWICCMES